MSNSYSVDTYAFAVPVTASVSRMNIIFKSRVLVALTRKAQTWILYLCISNFRWCGASKMQVFAEELSIIVIRVPIGGMSTVSSTLPHLSNIVQ